MYSLSEKKTTDFDTLCNVVCQLLPPIFSNENLIREIDWFSKKIPREFSSKLFCLECSLNEEPLLDWGFLLSVQDPIFFWMEEIQKNCKEICHSPLFPFFSNAQKIDFFRKHRLPFLSLGFDGENIFPNLFISNLQKEPQAFLQIVQDSFTLQKKRIPEPLQTHLQKVLLHHSFFVTHFGFLFGRDANGIRLSLRRSQATSAKEFDSLLQKIGLPKIDVKLIHILEKLEPFVEGFSFSCDIDEQISPKIGIKPILPKLKMGQAKARWSEIFTLLEQEKIITEESKTALHEWQGASLLNEEWIFKRELHHIKFVCDQGEFQHCKAYLFTEILPAA